MMALTAAIRNRICDVRNISLRAYDLRTEGDIVFKRALWICFSICDYLGLIVRNPIDMFRLHTF